MKKIAMLCCALAALCFVSMAVVAEDKGSEPTELELTGEAVDISCYLTGKSGEAHAGCATTCVSGGKPIGFVIEKEGKSILLFVMDGDKPAKDILGPHMGKQITVKGTYQEKEGMKILQVKEVV